MQELNFASLLTTVLLAVIGAPLLFHRAGYPPGKTALGSITAVVVLVGVWGIISSIQRKAGLDAVPLGWILPLVAGTVAWRFRNRLN